MSNTTTITAMANPTAITGDDTHSQQEMRTRQHEQHEERIQPRQDAFSKYSNDTTRLRTLLCREEDDSFDVTRFAKRHYVIVHSEGSASKRPRSSPSDDVRIRKTKISFELHPSLILDEVLQELDDMDEMDKMYDPDAEQMETPLDFDEPEGEGMETALGFDVFRWPAQEAN